MVGGRKFYTSARSGAILGVGFMFRSQPAIFLLAIIIFLILLRKTPKFKISTVALLILFFVLCCSPMLSYNYTTQEKLIDSNSNYYVAAHSKYYTQEWKDLLFDNMDYFPLNEQNQKIQWYL